MAVGIEFSDAVVLLWPKSRSSTVFPDLAEMVRVHGHDGKTLVEWID